MPLIKSKGNMYRFVSHTWNGIKGLCPHDCSYCYMKRFKQNPLRVDKREFKTDLGQDNFIFVGSSCDMWAEGVPDDWILQVLDYCHQFENRYLFQTKNPERILNLIKEKGLHYLPPDSTIGTTIETNRRYHQMGKAPSPDERATALADISIVLSTMVTVEPIMDFDVDEMASLIKLCDPAWVNIGADSKGHGLTEPSWDKVLELMDHLKYEEIDIKIKDNLRRLQNG